MSRKKSDQALGAAVGVAGVFLSPGFLAYHWPFLGWLLVVTSALAFGYWVHARWASGGDASSWPKYLPRSKAVPLLALWLGPVAYGGLDCGADAREAQAAELVRKDAEAEAERRRQYAREMAEQERLRAQERERVQAARIEAAKTPGQRMAEAADRIGSTGDGFLDQAVCDAEALAARLPPEVATSRDGKAFARLVAKARRQVLALRRREAIADRGEPGLLCADGTLSPTCMCNGSHQGCCSHHGGVAGCERLDPIEPVTFECAASVD